MPGGTAQSWCSIGHQLAPAVQVPCHILHQLAEAGYLTRQDEIVAGRRRKKYRLTRTGQSLLKKARAKLRELVGELLDDRDRMAESRKDSAQE